MKKKKRVTRAEVLWQMMALAVHPVNDAVKLAYLTEEQAGDIARLDLTGLTEFRRNSNGTVEIKFADRVKALETLLDRLEEDPEEGAAAFLRALEAPALLEEQEFSRR